LILGMDPEKRAVVLGLASQGWSVAQIVYKTKYQRSFVNRWYRRNNTEDKPRSGRPSKLVPAVLRKVHAVMKVRWRRVLF